MDENQHVAPSNLGNDEVYIVICHNGGQMPLRFHFPSTSEGTEFVIGLLKHITSIVPHDY